MESNDHKEDFEIFLKEKADSYKMYPSEKVWADLNDHLHPHKKWPYLVVAAIFLGLGFGGKIYDNRNDTPYSVVSSSTQIAGQKGVLAANIPSSSASSETKAVVRELYPSKTSPGQLKSHLPLSDQGSIPSKNFLETGHLIFISPVDNESGLSPDNAFKNKINSPLSLTGKSLPLTTTFNSARKHEGNSPSTPYADSKSHTSDGKENHFSKSLPLSGTNTNITERKSFLNHHSPDINGSAAANFGTDQKQQKAQPEMGKTAGNNSATAIKVKKPGKNHLGWQLYFSPTVSYRKLYGTVNQNSYSNAMMYSSLPGRPHDINSAVSQSPSVGMELGTAMVYSINKRFRVKGGLQFNYSQYSIGAYNYNPEIAPLSAAGIGHTEIKALSFYRNFEGFSIAQLRNERFSISIPVGAELVVLGNKNVQFNIAGTLQPGFMLNNNAYLLSTNLRNYAKVPSLYRNFNINTAVEAFLSINRGSFKWSIGPQFRYQLLSSFKQNYPIKEHLYDYGFKVGMMKTLR